MQFTTLFKRPPLLTGNEASRVRQELLDYFVATFDRYEQLFEVLNGDQAFYKKPISLRHPLIFYLGHTATFFTNKLILAGLIEKRINPRFESMFAVGVDEMSWDDVNEANYDWPSVEEVKAYRNEVREMVCGVIRNAPLKPPLDWRNPWWSIPMGIEHERIHLETSSVLIRQQELQYVRPHPAWPPCRHNGPAPRNDLVLIPPGPVTLGKNKADPYYGWDNEFGAHTVEIQEFKASRYLVSNGEFMEFIEAGGYTNDSLWEEEGRSWKDFSHARHPSFWVRDAGAWKLRLLLEEIPMPWDWPVEVNYHEAKAFCNWKKISSGQPVRLPTEDEWHRLLDLSAVTEVPADRPHAANLHLDHWASSCPVTQFRHGELYDVVGNVWQWTETPIYPFDGFEVHPLYDDFTTPTFDDRHNLFKGGSWISCGNESQHTSRYAFRRHFFQHAGFRYVVADAPATVSTSRYETDKMLSEYAEFHYGDDYFGVPNYAKSMAELAIRAMGAKPARKALDLGCATGRASFELARHFDHVTGIDFSTRFIGLAIHLADEGVLRYTIVDEGELMFYKERKLTDLNLAGMQNKVEFFQGDACNLKPIFSAYDLILAANLIDRLYSPAKFLETVHERLNPGGLLVIASPYTWLEEHTKKEEWIGGFKKDGESLTTLDGLKQRLGRHFRLLQGPQEVPFVIRETSRKFQHSLAEATVWEKIS